VELVGCELFHGTVEEDDFDWSAGVGLVFVDENRFGGGVEVAGDIEVVGVGGDPGGLVGGGEVGG
jgi:hypothetical protein